MAGANPGTKVEHDEWIAFPRRYLPEASMDKLYPELPESAPALPNTTNKPTS